MIITLDLCFFERCLQIFLCPFQPFFSIFGLCGQTELSILVYLQLQKQFRWQIPTIPDLVELESKHVKAMVFFAPWSAPSDGVKWIAILSFGQCANKTRILFWGLFGYHATSTIHQDKKSQGDIWKVSWDTRQVRQEICFTFLNFTKWIYIQNSECDIHHVRIFQSSGN